MVCDHVLRLTSFIVDFILYLQGGRNGGAPAKAIHSTIRQMADDVVHLNRA